MSKKKEVHFRLILPDRTAKRIKEESQPTLHVHTLIRFTASSKWFPSIHAQNMKKKRTHGYIDIICSMIETVWFCLCLLPPKITTQDKPPLNEVWHRVIITHRQSGASKGRNIPHFLSSMMSLHCLQFLSWSLQDSAEHIILPSDCSGSVLVFGTLFWQLWPQSSIFDL